MQAVIFTGIQGTGKSTFFKDFLFRTHVLVSLDLFKTRTREKKFFDLCIQTRSRFAVDNTNPAPSDRERYILPAKEKGYEIIGCHFVSDLDSALKRNSARPAKEIVPERGVRATLKKMKPPGFNEGFDKIYRVEIDEKGFRVSDAQGNGVLPHPLFRPRVG